MKDTYKFALDILSREDIEDVLEIVIDSYSKRYNTSQFLINMISTSLSNAIILKDKEIQRWYNCVEYIPKKTQLSNCDKNINTVLSYCSTYLNFPKFYKDSILDPMHKRFIGINYFKNDKYSIQMWQLFKEIVIPQFEKDINTDSNMDWGKGFGNDETNYLYTKWCIENIELIEKS